jgi:hypothetical protein
MREQNIPQFNEKDQCVVTGKTKTSAIHIDLKSGKIIDTTGAHFDEY